jgi:DNA-binding HxlR family transcriptional regulator
MSAKQLEEQITSILTNPKLLTIKAMIEKDHAIDCLFLLLMGKGRWKEAKAFMNRHHLTLSDGTFRARMIEIEHLGLAKSTQIDPLKKYYTITPHGQKIASMLLEMLQKI